jgi:putative DNA primase/helicase
VIFKKKVVDSNEVGEQTAAPVPSILIRVLPSEPAAVEPQDSRTEAAGDSSSAPEPEIGEGHLTAAASAVDSVPEPEAAAPEEADAATVNSHVQPEQSAHSFPENPQLPEGYFIDNGSLYGTDDKGEPDQITDGTPLCVPMEQRLCHGDGWAKKTIHVDADGRRHECAFSAADITNRRTSIISTLADAGLKVCPGKNRALLNFLQQCKPDVRQAVTDHGGWVDDTYDAYAHGDVVIGNIGGEQVKHQPEQNSPTTESMTSSGSLTDWQTKIAEPVKSFPLAMFMVLASLAGLFLRIFRQDSGGFHLFGPSSCGKTTAGQIAGSACGRSSDPGRDPKSFFQRWFQTANSLEAIAACHSDNLLCLDELGTITSDLGHVIYMLAGGSGKGSLDSHRRLRERRSWRINILSTGEKTVREVIEDGGRQAKAGHSVRLIDIPAVGIFKSSDGTNTADVVNDLKDKCSKFYGTAFPAMVKCLIAAIRVNPDQVLDGLRAEFDAASRALTPADVRPEQGRAIRRFAAVLVAGLTAARYGILPYSAEEIWACVRTVLDLYLNYSPSLPDSHWGLVRLQGFLLSNHSSFPSVSDPNARVSNAKCFSNNKGLFLMNDEQLATASGIGASGIVELAKTIKENGFLHISEVGRLKSKVSVASAGGKIVRLYAIRPEILSADLSGDDKDVVTPSVSPEVAPMDDGVPATDAEPRHSLISGHQREMASPLTPVSSEDDGSSDEQDDTVVEVMPLKLLIFKANLKAVPLEPASSDEPADGPEKAASGQQTVTLKRRYPRPEIQYTPSQKPLVEDYVPSEADRQRDLEEYLKDEETRRINAGI